MKIKEQEGLQSVTDRTALLKLFFIKLLGCEDVVYRKLRTGPFHRRQEKHMCC